MTAKLIDKENNIISIDINISIILSLLTNIPIRLEENINKGRIWKSKIITLTLNPLLFTHKLNLKPE